MKKRYLIYIGTIIPSICCAETTSGESGDLFFKIIGGVFLFILVCVALIYIDSYRQNKKNEINENGRRTPLPEEKREKVRNIQDIKKENVDLKNELDEKKKEIEKKDDKIKLLNEELLRLRKESLNKSSSTSNSDSGNSDGNKEQESDQRGESEPIISDKNSIYNDMTVANGSLVKAESEQTTYYRTWCEGGEILFEFVNNDRTRKAINNRTIIIEPFCIKLEYSKSPDSSEMVETITPGILNEDYSLRKKAEIIYK